jgi:hypothetical protein
MNLENLKTELNLLRSLEAAIPSLEKLFSDAKSRLEILEETADLNDGAALAEISSLQTLLQLKPRRTNRARADFQKQLAGLFASARRFRDEAILPRYSDLKGKVAARVRKKIASHYADETLLEQAVEASSIVTELNSIVQRAQAGGNEEYRPAQYAERLIAVWADLDVFEAKHAN